MNDSSHNKYAAKLISKCGPALAGYATSKLMDELPAASSVLSGDAGDRWRACLTARLDDLGAALSSARPEIFVDQLAWAKAAYTSRGVPAEMFRSSLRLLRGVVAEELPAAAAGVTTQYMDQALSSYDDEYDGWPGLLSASEPAGRLAAAYLLHVFEGNRREASRLVLNASDADFDVPTIYEQVLVPAQQEIGRMWLAGEITIGEEHFATDTTKRLIAQLADRADYRDAHGKVALTATTTGNQHDMGIHLVGSLLEIDGWRVIQLGADVPIADLVQSVSDFGVDLVVLSAALAVDIPTLGATIQSIRTWPLEQDVKIIVGGMVLSTVPDLAEQLGADGYADSPSNGIRMARELFDLPLT